METGSDNRFSPDWRTDPTTNIGELHHQGHDDGSTINNSHMEESHPITVSKNQVPPSPSSSSQNPFQNHCDSDNNIGNRGMMNNDHNSLFTPSPHEPSSPGNPFQHPPKTEIQDSFGAFDSTNVELHNNSPLVTGQGHQNSLGSSNLETLSESSSEIFSDSSDEEIDIAIDSMLKHVHAQNGDDVVAGQLSASSSISSATGSIEEFGTKEESSEIQNPPVQVMERPGGGDTGYVFPPHVFDRNTANPTGEWSTASNESLFSIYMGNMSFTSELMCFNNKSSTELDKPGNDMFMLDTPPDALPTQQKQQQPPDASPIQQQQPQPQPQPKPQPLPPPPVSKFTDISQRTAELHEENSKVNEAKAFETMREVIMENSRTTENAAAKTGDGNSRHRSDGSTQSFAFQSPGYKDKSAASKGDEHKQKQQNQSENKQQQEGAKAAVEAPNIAPPKKFLSCFSCCPFC